MDDDTIGELLDEYWEGTQGNWKDTMEESMLSRKEFVVYMLTLADVSAAEIADELGISEGNVDGKKGRIREKTDRARQHMRMIEDYGEI